MRKSFAQGSRKSCQALNLAGGPAAACCHRPPWLRLGRALFAPCFAVFGAARSSTFATQPRQYGGWVPGLCTPPACDPSPPNPCIKNRSGPEHRDNLLPTFTFSPMASPGGGPKARQVGDAQLSGETSAVMKFAPVARWRMFTEKWKPR